MRDVGRRDGERSGADEEEEKEEEEGTAPSGWRGGEGEGGQTG